MTHCPGKIEYNCRYFLMTFRKWIRKNKFSKTDFHTLQGTMSYRPLTNTSSLKITAAYCGVRALLKWDDSLISGVIGVPSYGLICYWPVQRGGGPSGLVKYTVYCNQRDRTVVCTEHLCTPTVTNKQIVNPNTTTPLLPSYSNQLIHKHGHAEPVFANLLRSVESIPSLAGRYDNSICRVGPPDYIGWRNRFLGS